MQVIPVCERQVSLQVWVSYQCPCLSAPAEKGMSELSGGGGDRWSLAEQEGSANQRRSAPQLEHGADGPEAVRRDTSQFTNCMTVSWWLSGD